MIKIKNRFTALLICLSILLTLISSYSSVFASGTISVGDYVQMGEYNGAPMLWRCISVDGSDALMIADTILCFKSFDAAGDDSMGSHGRGTNNGSYRKLYGSNYWADSNIRSWLNSDNTAGNVEFMCGNEPNKDSISRKYNEYENESGFLTNFSFDEKAIIKTVSQKAILDKNEYADMSSYGTEAFEYNIYRENSMTNYDSAYSEQVSDKIFLPDIKQFETLCNNLGEDYAKGVISENAFSNASNLVENGFSANANWGWWLRTPVTEDSCFGVYVRYVRPDAKEVGLDYAMQTHLGIRPAFYIDGSITTIKAGTGTADDPYKPQKVTEEISSGTAVLSRFSENVVNISGNAGEENAGKTATVILIPKASYNSISTAKYIGTADIKEDGSYSSRFKAIADENDVLIVKIENQNVSYSVTSAKAVSDMPLSFDISYNDDKKVALDIKNVWMDNPTVCVFIAVYNSDNSIKEVFLADKDLDFNGGTYVSEKAVTEGRVKAFIWDAEDNLIPLAIAKEFPIPTLN